MRTCTNGLLVTAAVVVTGSLFAQPELIATNDPQARLVERIAAMRGAGESTPASLIEPLRALALLYEEGGDHAQAIIAIEEARYVTRVHQGLSSADEALLLRQQIRIEKSLGLHERVWNLEQEMVTIARQNHDDIRMAPIFRELAEDRADALREYRTGSAFPPEIELGCYYVPGRRRYDDTRGDVRRAPRDESDGVGCRSGQSYTVLQNLRADVLLYYADAIEVILTSGDYASEELRDLEKAAFRLATFPAIFPVSATVGTPATSRSGPLPLVGCLNQPLDPLLASEILGSCLAPLVRTDELVTANVGGGASLLRLIAYEFRSGAPAATRANAIADFADWNLLIVSGDRRRRLGSSERAFRLYERAYRELRQDDEARTSIFSPEIPVAFDQPPPQRAGMPIEPYTPAPDLFASTATTESSRYIDVSFEVTKYGLGERIQILETSKGATRGEERELVRLIERLSFRPRFADGELADAAPVVVRYPLGP